MFRLPSAVRRPLWFVAVLLGITMVGFLLLRAAPGVELPEDAAWYMQYPLFLGRLARGEFCIPNRIGSFLSATSVNHFIETVAR